MCCVPIIISLPIGKPRADWSALWHRREQAHCLCRRVVEAVGFQCKVKSKDESTAPDLNAGNGCGHRFTQPKQVVDLSGGYIYLLPPLQSLSLK